MNNKLEFNEMRVSVMIDGKEIDVMIIKECSKVIKNGGYWSGGPVGERKQCTPPEIAKMIEEHFGIE